jgi:hypothetical protein
MGTWGHGNFENDGAAEHLIALCRPLVEQIRQTVANPELMQPDEDDSDVMMANIEILGALGRTIGRTDKEAIGDMIFPFPYPPASEIETWKREYLKIWDAYIDGLQPQAEFKSARRKTITETFDRLIQASKAGPPIKN